MRMIAALLAVALLPGLAGAYGGYYGHHVRKKKAKGVQKIEADGHVVEAASPQAKSTATAEGVSGRSSWRTTVSEATVGQTTALPGAAPSLLGHTGSSLSAQGGAGIGGPSNASGRASTDTGDTCPANMRRVPNSNGGSNCAPSQGAP